MEEIKEETIKVSKKTNRFRSVLGMMGRVSKRISLSNLRRPDGPWVRILERKGSKTLVWGMGGGKLFGSIPLDPEVAFSVDQEGVNKRRASRSPVSEEEMWQWMSFSVAGISGHVGIPLPIGFPCPDVSEKPFEMANFSRIFCQKQIVVLLVPVEPFSTGTPGPLTWGRPVRRTGTKNPPIDEVRL